MIWADSAYRRVYLKEALAHRKIELSIAGDGLKEGFWVPKDKIMNFEMPQKTIQVLAANLFMFDRICRLRLPR